MRYFFILLLTACGSQETIRYVDRPVTVKVPVIQPCDVLVPEFMEYATARLTAGATDFEKIQSLLIERKERGATEAELRALLILCVEI